MHTFEWCRAKGRSQMPTKTYGFGEFFLRLKLKIGAISFFEFQKYRNYKSL